MKRLTRSGWDKEGNGVVLHIKPIRELLYNSEAQENCLSACNHITIVLISSATDDTVPAVPTH